MSYQLDFTIDLKRNPYPGLYVAIEGPDGSGKTTQVKRLQNYLSSKKHTVVTTSEPNDSLVVGKLIRKFLSGEVKLPSTAFQYLMSADRADNHASIVYPALEKGDIVITHRSFWSAIPYGLLDKGIPADTAHAADFILAAQGILSMYNQFISPDITFYLYIPTDVAMERMRHRGGKSEIYEKKNKIEKIIAGYRLLLSAFPEEFVVIDAERSIEETTENMLKVIEEKIS